MVQRKQNEKKIPLAKKVLMKKSPKQKKTKTQLRIKSATARKRRREEREPETKQNTQRSEYSSRSRAPYSNASRYNSRQNDSAQRKSSFKERGQNDNKSEGRARQYDKPRYNNSREDNSRYDKRKENQSSRKESRYNKTKYEGSNRKNSRYDRRGENLSNRNESRYNRQKQDGPRRDNSKYDKPNYNTSKNNKTRFEKNTKNTYERSYTPKQKPERVQKIISASGEYSRRRAEELIREKRVTVNNKVIEIGACASREKDIIKIDGIPIKLDKKVCYALNKPKGILVTKDDPEERQTIFDLPAVINIPEKVNPIGRLDALTEGLILLTNDGELANKIMHPSKSTPKTYRVRCEPEFTEEELQLLSEGIDIEGIPAKATEIIIHESEPREIILTIHEGRNRIVRKMMEALNKKVFRLMRIAIGEYDIGTLKQGKVRKLKANEISLLTKKPFSKSTQKNK